MLLRLFNVVLTDDSIFLFCLIGVVVALGKQYKRRILANIALVAALAGIVDIQVEARPNCDVPNPPPICGQDPPDPLPDTRINPTGTFMALSRSPNGLNVSGTATDPDAPGPVEVAISATGSGYAGSVWASGSDGAFSGTVPAREGTSVCATAINRNRGENQSLGCRPLNVVVNPFGSLNAVFAESGGLRISGWAIDADAAAPIDVHVYIDAKLAKAVTAADCCVSSPHPPGATDPPYGESHAYRLILPNPERGRHTVCVYGINVGPGDTNTELGCKTFTGIGGPFGDGSPPKSIGDELSLEPWPDLGMFVRVRDDVVYIAPIDGMNEMDVSDARFRKVKGLSDDNCISFESIKYPGHFLRHDNSRIKLQAGGLFSPLSFNADATFCLNDGRYESANQRGYYLRSTGSELVLAHVEILQDYDAIYDTYFFENAPASLGFYFFLPPESWKTEGENEIVEASGECTGLAPLWGTPPTKCVMRQLTDQNWPGGRIRPVDKCATAKPISGFYPWIKFTARHSGIFKIETGNRICAW